MALGDSFTEGVGDELPDGRVRGWADLVALGLASAVPGPVGYANLAIRGRLLHPIATEQVDAAITLRPELVSINGGGNDILRPRVSISGVARQLLDAVDRLTAEGIHVVLASGANPSRHMPMGGLVQSRGDALAASIRQHLPRRGVTFVDNWADQELAGPQYWSRDRIHLNAAGHARVAKNVLCAVDVPAPEFGIDETPANRMRGTEYWREYVLPWIGRRLTGRSSGDNRAVKSATLQPVNPRPQESSGQE